MPIRHFSTIPIPWLLKSRRTFLCMESFQWQGTHSIWYRFYPAQYARSNRQPGPSRSWDTNFWRGNLSRQKLAGGSVSLPRDLFSFDGGRQQKFYNFFWQCPHQSQPQWTQCQRVQRGGLGNIPSFWSPCMYYLLSRWQSQNQLATMVQQSGFNKVGTLRNDQQPAGGLFKCKRKQARGFTNFFSRTWFLATRR